MKRAFIFFASLLIVFSISAIQKSTTKSDLEIEIQKLRKELNDFKIKEVEKQQNKFGVGIN